MVFIDLGDIDEDGDLDVVTTSHFDNLVGVMLNNGDGTFTQYTSIDGGFPSYDIDLHDVNQDGHLDSIVAMSSSTFGVAFGTGSGTFSSYVTYGYNNLGSTIELADLDRDGYLDVVAMDTASSLVFFGQAGGSFSSPLTLHSASANQGVDPSLVDLNGDGFLDIVQGLTGDSAFQINFGNGDGTFTSAISTASQAATYGPSAADLNNDGALDLFVGTGNAGSNEFIIYLGDTRETATMAYQALASTEDARAAIDEMEEQLNRITSERGAIGAAQSRLESAFRNTQSVVQNYMAAESQIRDADVAFEAAELVRQQILQQAGAAVLGQANQQPAIALRLLENG